MLVLRTMLQFDSFLDVPFCHLLFELFLFFALELGDPLNFFSVLLSLLDFVVELALDLGNSSPFDLLVELSSSLFSSLLYSLLDLFR